VKKEFIVYCRVSTSKQEHGIDAQIAAAKTYVNSVEGIIINVHSEEESGKNNNRVGLSNAIEECKEKKATLLIAKLDRLSRNASFLHSLKERLNKAGVEVIAADMPEVLSNTLMLSVMAGMAQHEREMISKRTKEGLAAARAKGKKIGRKKGCDTSKAVKASIKSRKQKAKTVVGKAAPIAFDMRSEGKTLVQIADSLNRYGFKSPGGSVFNATTVRRMLLKHNESNAA
jgi:DNA invertase Pin-like site-specific DNA recombinase